MIKNVVNAVECAIEFDGKFLVIQRPTGVHAGGLLAFVGGKVEESDAAYKEDILKKAIKREVFEEVGITLECDLAYVTTSYFLEDNKNIPHLDVLFHAKLSTKPTVVASPREVPAYFWMTKEEIYHNPNSPDWLKKDVALIN